MKHSIKGLFVILAIVMSFVLVQGVYARDRETFIGTVTSVDDREIELEWTTETGTAEVVTIYLNTPSWYWEDVVGDHYPEESDYLKIEAFYCNILPGWVGISVCYLEEEDDCIKLRDATTLKPLWNTNAKTTDLFDTSAEATGDGESNVPKDWDKDYDYDWDVERGLHKGNDS